jgi:hypothetical protein
VSTELARWPFYYCDRGEQMTDKWADYLISAVRYNAAETHIEKVRVHVDNGDSVGPASEWTRAKVIAQLEAGYSFVTILKSNGKWQKGATVRIVVIHGEKFIRTDADQTKEDNLGSLPRF